MVHFASPLKVLPLKSFVLVLTLLFSLCLQGCGSRPFCVKNIVKADIDLVADAHRQEMFAHLRALMIKLYKRNPRELKKTAGYSIDTRLSQVFGRSGPLDFIELGRKQGEEALGLCFDPTYTGDRVFALMVGLTGMVRSSYNDKPEQFMLDTLDEQKLYNCARNIEIMVWRLKNRRNQQGRLLLLTNSSIDEEENLSFERLFGKMIALQDMMARITADRGNRNINMVVHSLASAAFLPVGM